MKTLKIIAEIGWNHLGDIGIAEKMIISAKQSGANVAKFQLWDPKHLKKGPWDTDGRREIYEKASLNLDSIDKLKNCCAQNDIEFLLSAFGTKSAKIIKEIGLSSIKIPSHETTNIKFLNFCSNNFKMIYFSSGASTKDEIIRAMEILKKNKLKVNLMHCVSSYPCDISNVNLKRLDWLRTVHEEIGLSDHTSDTITPAFAVMKGATVLEKHFTIDNELPGRDNKFALNPLNFRKMTNEINLAYQSLIDHGVDYQDSEKDVVMNYRGRWEPHDYE